MSFSTGGFAFAEGVTAPERSLTWCEDEEDASVDLRPRSEVVRLLLLPLPAPLEMLGAAGAGIPRA